MKYVHRYLGLLIVMIIVCTLGTSQVQGQAIFPEYTSIPGMEGLGYTTSQDWFTYEGSNYNYHEVLYSKSWDPSPFGASARVTIYQFNTEQIDFYKHDKILDLVRWKDNIEVNPKLNGQPNFITIEDSESLNERAMAYSYIPYHYGYSSPDAELDPWDAKLDEDDRLAVGRYVVLRDPFAIKIELEDLPGAEFNLIKNIIFEYAESLIGSYQPSEQPIVTTPETSTLENNEIYDLEVHLTYEDAIIGLGPSNNQHIIIGIFDPSGNYVESYNNVTDENGIARFGYHYPVDEGYTVKVAPVLEYRLKPDESFFLISDGYVNSNQAVTLDCGDVVIKQKEDLRIQCSLEKGQLLNEENHSLTASDYIKYYNRGKLTIEYYMNVLSHKPTQELPIRIVLNGPDNNGAVGYLDFEDGVDIFVTKDYSSAASAFFPGVVYHEISHYMMYDMYDTVYPYTLGNVNHQGYMNPSTADSFAEGFAFFMEQYLQEVIEKRNNAVEGPLEIDYVAWEAAGRSEPMAFASLLYDLVDGDKSSIIDDDPVDRISIWNEISAVNNTVADFYNKIIHSNPENKTAIDQVFIDHGFYAQTDEITSGAGIYNIGEAFIDDSPMNGIYDEGEQFIDYYAVYDTGEAYQEYKEGAKVGCAAYRSNPTRERFVPYPGQFIKVTSGQEYFDVQVTFEDTPYLNYVTRAQNVNGKMYVHVPPKAYNAIISIVPENQSFDNNPLVIQSNDFYSKEQEAMALGYFYEADFDNSFADTAYLEGEDGYGLQDDWAYEDMYNQRDYGDLIGIVLTIIFVVLVIVVAVIVLFRMNKKSETRKPHTISIEPAIKEDLQAKLVVDQETWLCQCGSTNVQQHCSICGEQKPIQTPKKHFCASCGQGVDQTSKFCSRCGHML